ncbi:MAG: Rrf2 family transcriptional regulator [Proteobacteria bacterium]|uniref:Rrf2 family transcriptional regulator n=1 Tax=Candidatus Avisuccinivibrio stercorigallinarum TaxID=2840704 RepID=A0A9D9DEL6_9GAMM|nr:Rrf2 family transcriptional regulator [Candidatus Avisuccinivibrio stercorigallinarum]
MHITAKLTIALHVLMAIKQFEGQYKTTSSFLAGSVNVNAVVIRNILLQLKAAGLITVRAGTGGSQLIKEPKDITLLDVYQAVVEDQDLFRLHENPNPQCPVGRYVHQILELRLSALQQKFLDDMKDITLQDLLDDLKRCSA